MSNTTSFTDSSQATQATVRDSAADYQGSIVCKIGQQSRTTTTTSPAGKDDSGFLAIVNDGKLSAVQIMEATWTSLSLVHQLSREDMDSLRVLVQQVLDWVQAHPEDRNNFAEWVQILPARLQQEVILKLAAQVR
eukprot:m.242520 g.242520  ORF g.242520 m.242520 type:complete len:135 (-) comp15330_c0_seq86:2477-2881(-)